MITGREFIQLANRWSSLNAPNGDEAVWRTAISRAYYGAFHLVLTFLENLDIRRPAGADGRQIHMWVQMALSKSGNANIVLADELLADLHECRKDADYELHETKHGTQSLAKQCHYNASDLVSLIHGCDPTTHAAIKSSIEAWRKIVRK